MFKVGDAYDWYVQSLGRVHSVTDLVWKNFEPPKAQFITWLAWKGRLKTSSFLSRIGVLTGSECVLCKAEEETASHLLLFCPFSWNVWSKIMVWWGIQWVIPGSVDDLMHWWLGWKSRKKTKQV